MMKIYQTPEKTPTETMPISLDQAKKQVQISDDEDNDVLTGYIETAIELIANDTNSDVLDTSNVLEVDLPYGLQSQYKIYCAPLRAFEKCEVKNGETYTEIDVKVTPGFHSFTVETSETVPASAIRFTFATGFTASKFPKVLKQAALIKISDFYDSERQGYTATAVNKNDAYARLIAAHVRHSI